MMGSMPIILRLGLSVSYHIIVNQHKGQLICNSIPD